MSLIDLSFLSNELLPEKTEKLIAIENDTKIHEGKPAHYYRFLHYLAGINKPKMVVEFGTWKGVSSACLHDGWPDAKVITIDINSKVIGDARRKNIDYRMNSDNVLDDIDKIDLCFIDVEHSYICTMLMVEKIKDKMADQSVLLFDDINLNDDMRDFWHDLDIGGQKIELPVHGNAGFGAVVFGIY